MILIAVCYSHLVMYDTHSDVLLHLVMYDTHSGVLLHLVMYDTHSGVLLAPYDRYRLSKQV
jgi:hypothetical protein